jgi:diadenosine tetraphosphate (Ap4A) HIT family hydrolase
VVDAGKAGIDSQRMSAECALCKSVLETPVVRELRFWRIAINRNQDLLGKTIICLERHEESVAALTSEEWLELHEAVSWTTQRLQAAFSPDHFNYAFLMNLDHHVHLHVIPRYLGTRRLAGEEFTDSAYPDAFQRAPTANEISPPAVIAAVAAALGA